jgi:hypothetical protein
MVDGKISEVVGHIIRFESAKFMASKEHGVESIASECLLSRFLNYKNGYSAKSVPKSDQAGI